MALVEELVKLHDVQKVDTQIYQREQALKALDSGEGLKQQAIELMKRHDLAAAELRRVQSSLKDEELALKSIEEKRAAVHHKLYGGRVTNPKELTDLQKEEEMFDTQIGHHEEAVLELMDQVESAQAKASALAAELETAKRRWKETVARTQSETVRLQKEIAALRPEREQLATLVEKPLLRRYDELRVRKDGVGMAITSADTCPGCHVKLTPQTMDRLREGIDLTVCDNCGRIIGWRE